MLRLPTLVALLSLAASPALAIPLTLAEVGSFWTGPSLNFTHAGFSNDADTLTPNVVFTRDNTRGLYNSVTETAYDNSGFTSPAGTLWALGSVAEFLADPSLLDFQPWAATFGGAGALAGQIIGADAVVYLTDDRILLDLTFTAWGQGGAAGGQFAYTRSTAAVPAPGALLQLIAAVSLLGLRRLHPRRIAW